MLRKIKLLLIVGISLLMSAVVAEADEPRNWDLVKDLVAVISVPDDVLNHPALANIGHVQSPAELRGFYRDLNSDGAPEIFVESARIQCGQSGCAYALFDGRTSSHLGEMGGNLIREATPQFNGWSVLEWSSHVGASAAAYAVFAYTGSEYAPVSYLQFPASSMTFPNL